jgi:ankyrin repeat protein
MLPAHRLLTSYDIDDRLIVAIIQHDHATVRCILESNRYRSTINQSLYFLSYRDDFNHPITPLGIPNSSIYFPYIYSSLAAACHFGSYEIVDILINYFHANINNQHVPGWKTPLHYAVLAKSNRFHIVQFLLQHGK